MKNIAMALLASVILTASAEEIPHRQIDSAQIASTNIIFKSRKTSWRVVHSCDLYITNESTVDITPLQRSRNIGSSDSLVITVDGNRTICDIKNIQEIAT
jgi:hypothetical protein